MEVLAYHIVKLIVKLLIEVADFELELLRISTFELVQQILVRIGWANFHVRMN